MIFVLLLASLDETQLSFWPECFPWSQNMVMYMNLSTPMSQWGSSFIWFHSWSKYDWEVFWPISFNKCQMPLTKYILSLELAGSQQWQSEMVTVSPLDLLNWVWGLEQRTFFSMAKSHLLCPRQSLEESHFWHQVCCGNSSYMVSGIVEAQAEFYSLAREINKVVTAAIPSSSPSCCWARHPESQTTVDWLQSLAEETSQTWRSCI